ncbi:hypothetical protein M408DRAFT_8679 [Serendipita vermifera MAFF 305830]|uniref:Uncharacterized protein n=1 Tax=Serendipita vermifera MAFF 305830 TaxID=933852 RepID=A0A0C3BAR0_SERVB|nr:hypothetical protein M408DRAFT_8679 [Serendipita vermifera MAFF 305830]
MTGKQVHGALEADERWGVRASIQTVYSRSPNEILLGIRFQLISENRIDDPTLGHGREFRFGGDEQHSYSKYILFQVMFFQDTIVQEHIRTQSTPLCSFMGLPVDAKWAIGKSFCALCGFLETSVGLLDLNTGQSWIIDMGRRVFSLEIFDAWLIIVMIGQRLEMTAIDIHQLPVERSRYSEVSPYKLPCPEGVAILENTIYHGFWEIQDYRSRARIFLAPGVMDQRLPVREDDTYVLLISQCDKYWGIRFHLSRRNSTLGIIEVCLPGHRCHNVACKTRKDEDDLGELLNSTPPCFQNPTYPLEYQDFGLQVARHSPTISGMPIINQIAGLDSPTMYHELNLSKGLPREDETEVKEYCALADVDGETGMFLTRKSIDSIRYDYGVYWF